MDIDGLASSTLRAYCEKKVVDNIYKAIPLFYWMTGRRAKVDAQAGRYTRKSNTRHQSGGRNLVVPINVDKNTTATSYSGYDVKPTEPVSTVKDLEYNWKLTTVAVVISDEEKDQNTGKEAVWSLLDWKIEEGEMSLFEKFNEWLFGDGTGNDNKDPLGLKALVNTTGTIGGLSRTTYTILQCQADATAMALAISGGTGSLTNMYNNLWKQNAIWRPDTHVTTQTLAEKYESLLQPHMRLTSKELGELGYDYLQFKGAPVLFDDLCDAGYWYMLNTKFLYPVVDPRYDFKDIPFRKPVNQEVSVGYIKWRGNFVCSNFQRQGRLTAKTA